MKKVRLISGVLVLTMMGSSLTACSNSDNKNMNSYEENISTLFEADSNINIAYVVVNEDNAIIFDEESIVPRGGENDIWVDYGDGKEYYQGYKVSMIRYRDKDELEEKVKDIIGEDGQITYEEDYGKVKK